MGRPTAALDFRSASSSPMRPISTSNEPPTTPTSPTAPTPSSGSTTYATTWRSTADMRKRGFNCDVDEVDSILIDEARTLLIISGPADDSTRLYYQSIARIVRNTDYDADEVRIVVPTESDCARSRGNSAWRTLRRRSRSTTCTSSAARSRRKSCTGATRSTSSPTARKIDEHRAHSRRPALVRRPAPGGGGQRAGADQRREPTPSIVTPQNFFRMYDKLAGMTGTAETEAAEFAAHLRPAGGADSHQPADGPCGRADSSSSRPRTRFAAVAEDISQRFEVGQPVLVGTASVEKTSSSSSTGIPQRTRARRARGIVAQAAARRHRGDEHGWPRRRDLLGNPEGLAWH